MSNTRKLFESFQNNLKEEVEDEINVSELKRIALETLPKEDIDTHDSDLYIKVTPESTALINKLKDVGLLSTFKSEIDGEMWYDIPFANMEDDYKDKTNESALSDKNKIKNYFGTVRSSVPYEVYKVNDKFYDGNGLEISKEEIDKLDFFNENEEVKEYRYITNHGIGPGATPEGVYIRSEDLPNGKTAIYLNRPLTDEELKKYDIKPEWIQESALTDKDKLEEYYKMPDNEHIIWDSEVDYYDEDYMNDVKDNQYQDYLDNFEPSEPPTFDEWVQDQLDDLVGSGAYETADEALEDMRDDLQADYEDYVENYKEEPQDFDTWYKDYIQYSSSDDWDILEDYLKENIFPAIDNQCKSSDILLLSGNYGSNYPDFRPSGAGGRLFKKGTEEFRDYMGNFDRVCITTQNGILGAICNDHDGTVSGQFYTLPDNEEELLKALNYEDVVKEKYSDEDIEKYGMKALMADEFADDLYYDGINAKDLTAHIDLLKPIKNTISGYTQNYSDEVKTESAKPLTENSIVVDNGDETYTIDTANKTYTIKTPKGEKTFTFDEMNNFVNQGRGMNRIYKPMSVLAYTDFKNGSLKRKWKIKESVESINEEEKGMKLEEAYGDDYKDLPEFHSAFQITRNIIFFVDYYRLGDNEYQDFSTSVDELMKNKRDISRGGQAQKALLPEGSVARKFYDKWDYKHLQYMTEEEYNEMRADLEVLKNTYNYIEQERDISFSQEVELSKEPLKKIRESAKPLTTKGLMESLHKVNEDYGTESPESVSKNIADTFQNYKAFKYSVGDLVIIKDPYDKTYKIYKPGTNYDQYIQFSKSKDYIEGWLYGVVQAKNNVI